MQAFMHRFFRGLKHRPYLSATFALGFVIFFVLQTFSSWHWATRLQIGWNTAIWLYLFMILKMMWRLDPEHILERAKQQDEGKWMILTVALIAIVVCLFRLLCSSVMFPKIKQSLKRF